MIEVRLKIMRARTRPGARTNVPGLRWHDERSLRAQEFQIDLIVWIAPSYGDPRADEMSMLCVACC